MRTQIVATIAVALVASSASGLELTDRQVKLGKELTMSTAQKIASDLVKLDAMGNEPILMFIQTRSGFAPAAMVIVDAINAVNAPVYAVIQSEAFGVGALVAAHCDKRFAFPHASLLFTRLEYDKAKVMKENPPLPVEAANAWLDRVNTGLATRLNLKADALKERSEKGWYLSAEEARQEGIITEVVTSVSWVNLVVETLEVKRTATTKKKAPAKGVKP
ncbi:MAG: ATP-dependent Clp protease protease subunit [Myxococcota bacterium]|jgi:ATP-dependent Clp protease protease subunit